MKELSDFFLRLEKESWTGELQVTASEGNAFVLIQNGRFCYAHRPIDRAAERLVKLVGIKVPPDNLVNSCHNWDEFVRLTMTQNMTEAERLVAFFKSDRLELFFRLFFWTNVELLPRPFEFDITSNADLSFYSKRELGKLVKEAQTRLAEWPVIQKKIGSSRRIFVSKVHRLDRGARGQARDAIDSALTQFEGNSHISGPKPFTDEQIQILNLCNGSNSVQEVVRLSSDGEFLTLRRILDLWDKGLIAPKEEESILQVKDVRLLLGIHDWKASIVISVFLTILSFFFSTAQLPPARATVPEPLLRGLELYRNQHGRYPVTLQELEKAKLIYGLPLRQIDYKLLNLNEYRIGTN